MGVSFGGFELVRRIAEGGMAEVFLANQRGPGGASRRVVVKRILPHLTRDHDFVTMFLDEARLVSRLSHPNIASLYAYGQIDGVCWLSMEHVDGVTVAHLIQRRKRDAIPLDVTLRVVSDVCAGLHYAHEARDGEGGRLLGVIHRDVSPQNVMISRAGAVKLIDFGVAKTTVQRHVTANLQVKGKLAYMAPEVLVPVAERKIDRRVDVFATGALLYEMIAGVKLFRRSTDAETLAAVRVAEPPSVAERGAPEALDAIIRRAVAKDPEQRYPTALAMQEELEALIARSPSVATPYTIGRLVERYVPAEPAASPAGLPIPSRFAPEGGGADPDQTPRVLVVMPRPTARAAAPTPRRLQRLVPVALEAEVVPSLILDEASEPIPVMVNVSELVSAGETEPTPPARPAVPGRGDPAAIEVIPPAEGATPVAISNVRAADRSVRAVKTRSALLGAVFGVGLVVVGLLSYQLAVSRRPPEAGREPQRAAMSMPVKHVATASVEAGPDAVCPATAPARPVAWLADDLPSPLDDEAPEALGAAAPGVLFLDTAPPSRVREAGRSLGATPVERLSLEPGVHRLVLEDDAGRRHVRRVRINPGKATRVFFDLE